MENRNVIDGITQVSMTKREMIEAIKKTFPDDEVGYNGTIAEVVITVMTDGTKMQSVCFGKALKVN